jgi:hypothetical protein
MNGSPPAVTSLFSRTSTVQSDSLMQGTLPLLPKDDVLFGGKRLPRAKGIPEATLRSWLANLSFVRHERTMPEPSRK